MRTHLFLSTLFAVSMIGGAALAEKPQGAGGAREPRAVQQLRAHGDTVDKAYAAPQQRMATAGGGAAGSTSTRGQAPAGQRAHGAFDHGANRINCSETGVDCLAHSGSHQAVAEAGAGSTGRGVQRPAFLDKLLGSDRTNFNEAGEDQGMSPRAANRAWASAAGQHHGTEGATVSLSAQKQLDRLDQQRSSARMSCNEADECSMSNKAMRKEWAGASIKAGTWTGPAKEPVSLAAIRIAAYHAAESASLHDEKVAQHAGDHAAGGHGVAPAAAAVADHH
jgi:hypothetical protein